MHLNMWRLFLLFCVVATINCDDNEWQEVRTKQGVVRGRKDPDGGLYSFYNIPYATVPKGPDRTTFTAEKHTRCVSAKAPFPAPAWLKPLEAVDKGIICMQPRSPIMDLSSKTQQEDCLVANVYVPDTEDKNLPVIVYIHGGAFEMGYGDQVTPKNLVRTKKVIVVNFNYRLGVQGFLCLGTDEIPGNAGLKDQVALLRWVRDNIASYGGNPDDVTIAGYSAGSVSADLLMLSKSAQGLFNKVILESGAAIGYIAIQSDPLENARSHAKVLNFTDINEFKVLQDFYINTPIELLLRSTFSLDGSVLFVPCIEQESDKAFLVDSPINIIKKGQYSKVPILIGVSNMEGSLQQPQLPLLKGAMNEFFSKFLPSDLQFENEEQKIEVGKKVKEFYFGDLPVGEETALAYVDYFGDALFAYSTLRSVKLHVEAGHDQIYLYEFSFVDDSIPVIYNTNVRRAAHCSQTFAVLDGIGVVSDSTSSEERKQIKTIIREMWYNFAVSGKPVPEGSSLPAWPAAGADGRPYMSLGQVVELGGVFLDKRGQFWEEIYQKYYREPVRVQPSSGTHTEL